MPRSDHYAKNSAESHNTNERPENREDPLECVPRPSVSHARDEHLNAHDHLLLCLPNASRHSLPDDQRVGPQQTNPEAGTTDEMDVDEDDHLDRRPLDGLNPRSEKIPVPIWRALKHLHRTLVHLGKISLIRLLRRYHAPSMAIPRACPTRLPSALWRSGHGRHDLLLWSPCAFEPCPQDI